jgi:energy-coupling factor transporter ATP-binding protein EcfA2
LSALSYRQPYPGLRPFDEEDRDYFFGRDGQTRDLRVKLNESRLVAVVGRSGCGKSSLVRAGLAPLLAEEKDEQGRPVWRTATFKPQGRPIEELGKILLELTPDIAPGTAELRRMRLDAMLRRSSQGLIEAASEIGLPQGGRLLIIVDQFEEIFRFEDPTGSNTDQATAFVRLLTEAITVDEPLVHVMLTMRLDFLGDCARFPRLPEAISNGQFLVPTLSRAERRAAIEQPAKKAGKLVRPEVTQRLLNEVGDDPDQLPVLQHVLMRMWQQAVSDSEITTRHYDETGGVAGAISRHADQIYNDLPSETHRSFARRLFKAISERDQRGRSIRHAMPFGEIAAIVGDDVPKMPPAEASRILEEVIDAFRAPECCFLLPAAGEKLQPKMPIDISHESLLRSWTRMTGANNEPGWIAEEDRDGRTYRGLLEAFENDYKLPMRNAAARRKWWDEAKPNEAWAERYGNKFAKVEEFVRTSNTKAFVTRFLIFILVAVTAISSIGWLVYWSYSEVQVRALYDAKAELRDRESQLQEAQKKIQEQQGVQDQLSRTLTNTIRQAQSTLSQSGDQKTRQELDSLLKQSGSSVPDSTAQRPVVDAGNSVTTLATDTGFMWIGNAQGANFTTLSGESLLPTQAQLNGQYLTTQDIYLRQAAPDRTNYAQAPQVGIMPEGTKVQILSLEPPFARPSGDQYWAKVRVIKLALSTVYFQFAGGSRDQAQQISKALQDRGYKIPSEDRTSGAAGKHEVRYFFAGQAAVAQELATATNQILQQLGYPQQLRVSATQSNSSSKTNPDGKLELWLEIPPK